MQVMLWNEIGVEKEPFAMWWNKVRGGSNMTGTNCDFFTHNQSWSYLNHLVSCGEITGKCRERLCRKVMVQNMVL